MYTKNEGLHHVMMKDLYELCQINSGSHNLNGLSAMHELLHKFFMSLADETRSIAMPEVTSITMNGEQITRKSGNALLVRKRPHLKRRILLCGHMDTVYGAGDPFQELKLLDDNTLNGPGVADMKGGLVVMLHALNDFEVYIERMPKNIGWDVFINADEEIGSVASSSIMCELAKNCEAALIYEPSTTPDGAFARNRKGNIKITLVANGISAHAGRDFLKGRNAICYLAEIITAINALNGQRDGVTFNVGNIAGGTALNIVPDKAVAKIDIRITFPDDASWVQEQLNIIELRHKKADYLLDIHSSFDRPPKRVNSATEQLFFRMCEVGKSMNLNINWADSGGCCDGNNLAALGIPVIDTLGVRGGNIHTSDEYILLDSLVERANLSTSLLVDLAEKMLVSS